MSQITTKFIGDNQVSDLKFRARNNQPVRARNNADSGDVNVFKVDTSDIVQLLSQTQIATTPTVGNDVVNKTYADSISALSRDAKDAVRAATNAALPANTYNNGAGTLTGNSNGALSAVDGVTLVANDRVLVKDESSGAHNGIYVVTQVGDAGTPYILTRSSDADTSGKVTQGIYTVVVEGSQHIKSLWALTTADPITLGTTALVFEFIGIHSKKESFTLSGTDITNQYVNLAFLAETDSVFLSVSGVVQYEGSDYTLSTVSGVTRLTFAGDLATGGNAALIAGDVLRVQYRYA